MRNFAHSQWGCSEGDLLKMESNLKGDTCNLLILGANAFFCSRSLLEAQRVVKVKYADVVQIRNLFQELF